MGLVTAACDDATDHLPIVTVEAIRHFAEGKFTAVSSTAGQPADSVFGMTVTRQE